ncbi:MAG: hypothetical protein JWQ66_1053 [Mucilaginibacter sp.]|nr:hypothetical protein [Mucilaginibacter sp.]
MKKILHITLKLLLVSLIFIGLQGKVLVRYAEIFNKNHKSEITHPEKAHLKASIIHCKLQCYTQHFQKLHVPVAALLFTLIIAPIITRPRYIPLKEKFSTAGPVRLLPLRAPPIFNL